MSDSPVPNNVSLPPEDGQPNDPIPNGSQSSTPPAPDVQQLIEAARKQGWGDYAMADIDANHKADNVARNEPHLRVQMVKLVDSLNNLLEEHATQLATALDQSSDAFALDHLRDLLTWQLGEFTSRSYIERAGAENEPPTLRGHQVSAEYARAFFLVDVMALTGELVAEEVEANRR